MPDDQGKDLQNVQLTQEEIKILKAMVEGQKAMVWIKKRSGSIATWITLMLGVYLAMTGQFKQWIQSIAQGG